MLLIQNGALHTMEEDNPIKADMLIRDGKIAKIGQGIQPEKDVEIINAEGLHVYPGFIDAHSHIGIAEEQTTAQTDYSNEGTNPVTPFIRAIDGSNPMDSEFHNALATGVTGVMVGPGSSNPMKLAAQLAKGLRIYENTKALSFAGNQVQTASGTITAQKIIVATHFPMLNKHGAYFLKLYQQRSYVIALENAKQPEGMYLDCADNGLSLRSAGRYLLLGGGGHRTGKQGLNWSLPEAVAAQYYPDAKILARWATQDCMTLDGMPYIGRYSSATPDLYVATGFQKWGMSTSMAAASILADLIQNRENPYSSLFSPQRSMMHKQLLVNGLEATANLLLPTKPRCPHLGCALHWNEAERSWDCSCHGSRFDEKGKVLNKPATDDMKHPPC